MNAAQDDDGDDGGDSDNGGDEDDGDDDDDSDLSLQVQTQQLQSWQAERQQLLKDQLYQLEKKRKTQEIENTLKELQEKEEMIRFFELHDKIRLIKPKQLPKEPSVEEEDEETLRAKRIKRRKFRHNV